MTERGSRWRVEFDCGCSFTVVALEEETARKRAWWVHRDSYGCGGREPTVTASYRLGDDGDPKELEVP